MQGVIMEITQSICCKELKKNDVLDSTGKKIGHIGDLTFKFDGQLRLSQFILSGPRFEEFLETIKVRPDKDPVFNAGLIEKMGDKIHLSTNANGLKTTLDKGAIPSDEIRLSRLEKMDIIDKDGVKVGRAIDVDFDVTGAASIIVGGGFFEETLESLGLKADVDLIVESRAIASIGSTIKLLVSKSDLAETMTDALKSPDVTKVKETMATNRDVTKVRLFGQRPY
jgi:sporulation protein YlmC with PRC-barrel domain